MFPEQDEASARGSESAGGFVAGPEATPGEVPGAAAGPPPGGQPGSKNPWKSTADGRTVFRRGTPFIIFWVWVAFATFSLIQVALPDHDYFSLELSAGLLAVTGLTYACALRPRVIADNDAILVLNPLRDHRVRWAAVTGVYLGDSVEISCSRPVPRKEKTIYCWALYSGRRSRIRSQQRANRNLQRGTGRAPAEVAELAQRDAVELMAAELARRSVAANQQGSTDAVLESRWAWLPVACVLVPAAALLALILAR